MNLLSNRIFYFSLFISFGVIANAIRMRHRKRRISNAFASRSATPLESFGNAFFPPDQAQTAVTVRELLEKRMKMDLSGLRPEDSFRKDLRFDEMSRDAFQKFLVAVEEGFDIEMPPVDSCMNLSFGRFVATVSNKIRRAPAGHQATEPPPSPSGTRG
jgi:hypothetical protein